MTGVVNVSAGQRIGSYRVLRTLGQGGMGNVYEVVHTKLGVHYALKVLNFACANIANVRKRFDAEGRALAMLNHNNVIRVIDLNVDDAIGVQYFVMDLVLSRDGDSKTLADVAPGSVDEQTILRWFGELSDALSYIHAKGIVHRDIKLNNILIAEDGRLVLSDFGISKFVEPRLREAVDLTITMPDDFAGRLALGTIGYLAPELLRGEAATPASDIYALGVVFFKLLTNVWYDSSLEPREKNKGIGTTLGVDAQALLGILDLNWKGVLPQMLHSDPCMRSKDLRSLFAQISTPDKKNWGKLCRRMLIVAVSCFVASLVVWIVISAVSRGDDRGAAFDAAFSAKVLYGDN